MKGNNWVISSSSKFNFEMYENTISRLYVRTICDNTVWDNTWLA